MVANRLRMDFVPTSSSDWDESLLRLAPDLDALIERKVPELHRPGCTEDLPAVGATNRGHRLLARGLCGNTVSLIKKPKGNRKS